MAWTKATAVFLASVVALSVVAPLVAAQDAYEPNDSKDEAYEIEPGEQISGTLDLNDKDWFAFEASEGDSITIDITSVGPAYLIGPDDTQLDAESPQTYGPLTGTAEQSGTYYIRLETAAPSAVGDYSFTVELSSSEEVTETSETATEVTTTTPPETTTSAPDTPTTDSTQSAADQFPRYCGRIQPIGPGQYSGSLSPNDVDVFTLDLEPGQYVTVSFEFAAPKDNRLIIFGDDQNVSFTAADGGSINTLSTFDREAYDNDIGFDIDYKPIHQFRDSTDDYQGFKIGPGRTQFRIYAENTSTCVGLVTDDETSGEWVMSFPADTGTPTSDNSADVTPEDVTTTTTTRTPTTTTTERTTSPSEPNTPIDTTSATRSPTATTTADGSGGAGAETTTTTRTETTDASGPGFTTITALIAVLAAALLATRRD